MKITRAMIALALSLAGGWASATVEVRFVNPEQFSDIKDANFRRQDDYLEGLQQHFQKMGEKMLPGKDLKIEITDVDLAGRIEPRRHGIDMIRILRDMADSPMIQLRYVVSQNGTELKRGEARLWDGAYLTGINRYSDGDPLRYDKRMIDKWFLSEFGPAKVAGK
ncbi:DUF3016 domain-containing protein [Pelomonas sp. KK5]|uniref:DUF3016 domain-containing protein n=1 Tax=Pelomonas sp. KK5 TaxID=1855730 RepID=UPI00097C1871|nr:DUF3016 domain-containing protein [Pelomonas sp. KK5]